MRAPHLLMVVLLAGMISCQIRPQDISRIWFYTSLGPATPRSLMTPTSFLSLKPDGSYTRDFGQFDYGTWHLRGKQIFLINQESDTISLTVQYLTDDHLRLALGNKEVADFECFPPLKDPVDPFSVANNRWRIAAARKETDGEIRQRLSNHCLFWETYFQWASKSGFSSVDVRNTPTLLTVYGNGFGLKSYSELPATWKFYFYDEEDCKKANSFMQKAIESHRIHWISTDNKYDMFTSAFHQLGQIIK